ncbi:hypothetical protein H0H92_013403 [Tricholoma furcatifolium]|nr:hypothetical protein H0H92_013403 [Tricholoma furcatifolium]
MLAGILLSLSLNLILSTTARADEASFSLNIELGTAHPNEPFWLESIKHQGSSAYNPDPSYPVFRNVKDFGAVGDGVTDDTVAINLAISSGNRCGGNDTPCNSSTLTPGLVYFPKGVYLVSAPINTYYYTQLIGDAKNPPTLLASADFNGLAVIGKATDTHEIARDS